MYQYSHGGLQVVYAMEVALCEGTEVPQAGVDLFQRLVEAVVFILIWLL